VRATEKATSSRLEFKTQRDRPSPHAADFLAHKSPRSFASRLKKSSLLLRTVTEEKNSSFLMTKHLKPIENWDQLAEFANSIAQIKATTGASSTRQIRKQAIDRFGKPTLEWLSLKKSEKAQQMLRNGDQIKNVSSALDFKYVQNFNRFFVRHTGVAPREFQRRLFTRKTPSHRGAGRQRVVSDN